MLFGAYPRLHNLCAELDADGFSPASVGWCADCRELTTSMPAPASLRADDPAAINAHVVALIAERRSQERCGDREARFLQTPLPS
jgi:hypothetical protein